MLLAPVMVTDKQAQRVSVIVQLAGITHAKPSESPVLGADAQVEPFNVAGADLVRLWTANLNCDADGLNLRWTVTPLHVVNHLRVPDN